MWVTRDRAGLNSKRRGAHAAHAHEAHGPMRTARAWAPLSPRRTLHPREYSRSCHSHGRSKGFHSTKRISRRRSGANSSLWSSHSRCSAAMYCWWYRSTSARPSSLRSEPAECESHCKWRCAGAA